ncbi:hypothetical protein HKCCE2091_01790 [Rhodobacterales bacterium HKCCE2091]|nr:hypothetical protein [Rhodobacterales bacterium HKCCE2091]
MSPTRLMLIAGIILIVGGVLSLLAPYAASIAVTLIVGWSFLIGGIVNLAAAFGNDGHRGSHVLFGLLGLLLGLSFLLDPLGGVVSLTILVGIVFLVSGGFRLALAWARREMSGFWILLLSGALSVLLGGLILSNLGGAAQSILGIIVGIELLSAGIGLVALSRMGR